VPISRTGRGLPFLELQSRRIGRARGPGVFQFYRLQRPVPELVVVVESFHVKPLIRILQSADRYHLLGLNRQQIKLLEGNREHFFLFAFITDGPLIPCR
jgi:hypothetical protein